MTWVRACTIDEVEDGEAVAVACDPPVAVFNVEGSWLATGDLCSHDKSSLADGCIDGDVVECSWHFAKFCLRTGSVLSLPATVDIPIFVTKVEDGVVFVDL